MTQNYLNEIKVISSSETRYNLQRRGQDAEHAVDKRSRELDAEYLLKARNTDRNYCGVPEGVTGGVENKLISLGKVRGIVLGAFGECSQPTHELLSQLAVSRVQIARPEKGKRGVTRTEKAEIALTTAFLRRSLSVAAVKAQTLSLLGRLETLGPGATAAASRRTYAVQQERQWGNLRRAHALSVRQGKNIYKSGFFKLD